MQRKPRKSNQLKAEERNISAMQRKLNLLPNQRRQKETSLRMQRKLLVSQTGELLDRNISAHAEKTATISVFWVSRALYMRLSSFASFVKKLR